MKISDEIRNEIREKYSNGAMLFTLCTEYGLSYTCIVKMVKDIRKSTEYKKICCICGTEFVAKRDSAIYCSKTCSSKAQYVTRNISRLENRPYGKAYETIVVKNGEDEYFKSVFKKPESMHTLAEIVHKARQKGMSYGEYMAGKRK